MPKILPNQTDIYALTDSRLSLGRSIEAIVTTLLKANIKIIQYREKKASARIMLEECTLIRKLTIEANACFIVNDHIHIAMLVDADGVHLGQDDLPLKAVRKLLGAKKIIGISTHNPDQALQAQEDGADYIGVGPIFPTKTKEDVCAPVGFEYLDWVAANCSIPFVAIGGIKQDSIASIINHGAYCCAMVSEIVGSDDIISKVAALRGEIAKAQANAAIFKA